MEILGIIIAVVIIVSVGIGALMSFNDKERANSQDMDRDKCAQCKLDKEWYDSKPLYIQIIIFGWWAGNRLACKMNGC